MYNYRMNQVPAGTFSQAAYNAFLHDRVSTEPLMKKEFKTLDELWPEEGGNDVDADSIYG